MPSGHCSSLLNQLTRWCSRKTKNDTCVVRTHIAAKEKNARATFSGSTICLGYPKLSMQLCRRKAWDGGCTFLCSTCESNIHRMLSVLKAMTPKRFGDTQVDLESKRLAHPEPGCTLSRLDHERTKAVRRAATGMAPSRALALAEAPSAFEPGRQVHGNHHGYVDGMAQQKG